METFQILKNGEPMGIQGNFEYILIVIRGLEESINRLTEHSPYTISRTEINKRAVAIKLLSEHESKNGYILAKKKDCGQFVWIKRNQVYHWTLGLVI